MFLKGLSGGQKRRLSVSLEALTDPNSLFLDEPTSGLDAKSAFQVMAFLKSYSRASKGRRVILTIHQPSSFIWQLIDNVVLLAKGKLMYEGSRVNMEQFFEHYGHATPLGWNPADHYVTQVNDEFRASQDDHTSSTAVTTVDEWARFYREWSNENQLGGRSSAFISEPSKEGNDNSRVTIEAHRANSFYSQRALLYRYFMNLWFNPGILGVRLAMYSMLALMVGALFWDIGNKDDYESIISRAAVLFYCVSFFTFMSVAVLPFTVMERDIVDKEVLNGYYNPIAYQLTQAIITIPAGCVLAGLVSVIIVCMLNLSNGWMYFLNMFLSLLISEALAQLVSHVVPHFVIGMAIMAGLFGFFMLFMGFMIVPSDFPNWLGWTYNVAFHTYSWRSFMVTEFQGKTFEDSPQNPFKTGKDVLTYFEIEDASPWNDMIVLGCYAVVLHLLSFVVLHIRYTFFKGEIRKHTKVQQGATKEIAIDTGGNVND